MFDYFNTTRVANTPTQRSKEKLAKKRKLDDKSLQIEKGRTEDGKNPYKKRRVATKKIKSSKNGVVTVVSQKIQ